MPKNQPLSLEDITRLGEKFYTEKLKEKFEKDHMGQYVVVDVEQNKYVINSDRLIAIEEARKTFGDKLFYIIQVGSVQNSNINFILKNKYAWNF